MVFFRNALPVPYFAKNFILLENCCQNSAIIYDTTDDKKLEEKRYDNFILEKKRYVYTFEITFGLEWGRLTPSKFILTSHHRF